MSANRLVPHKPLGSQGLMVSQQGLGCMVMSYLYKEFNRREQEPENLKVIAKALELGINFFDTAWIYQSFGVDGDANYTNEELLGKAIAIHGREKFVISTKFGIIPKEDGPSQISNSEETIRSQLKDSLSRLNTDYIDLYFAHRVDSSEPIEDMMHVLKALAKEKKIGYIGLSECTPSELRRAHAVHPITAIQMEWSLQSREIEPALLPTARELGVGIVAYSPMDRGLLTNTVKEFEQLPESDWRRTKSPRFSPENIAKNQPSEAFLSLAEKKKLTPTQLALTWLHAQGEDVFPIPGTKSVQHLEENVQAVWNARTLTESDTKEIQDAVKSAVGARYDDMEATNAFETRQ
jgi:aryl-alcohol dehydrogenase-like predicted oxidoreductase